MVSWELIESVLLLLVAGSLAGVLAGLLGIGGGLVLVPALVFVFDLMEVPESVLSHMAIGTSLSTIIATSLSSARAHLKRGSLDKELFFMAAIPTALGAGVGSIVAGWLSGGLLALLFAIMAIIVSGKMILPSPPVATEEKPLRRRLIGNLTGLTGVLSAMIGVGGGAMNVPLMTSLGMQIHQAVGTSASLGFVIALPGTLGFIISGWGNPDLPGYTLGFVHWLGALCICSMTVACAPLGAAIAHRLNTKRLKQFFAIFLLFVALRTLWRLWS